MNSEPSILFVFNKQGIGGPEIKIANALALSEMRVELACLNSPDTAIGRVDSVVSVTNLDCRGMYSINSFRRLRDLLHREQQTIV